MKILVNCALPYANGSLHPGHIAGAYLNADAFVRYHRMIGDEVLFVSGSDEHGTPITITAEKEKVDPYIVSSRFHEEHLKTFRNLDINFDIFTRTTYPEHAEVVREFFLDFMTKGYLTERMMVSPFCLSDNRFMPDRYIEGTCPYCGFPQARGDQCDNCGRTLDPQDLKDPRCILHGTTPEFRETKHLFFRLDLFQKDLLEWLSTRTNWRPNVMAFTRNFIRGGLKERPITRDISWGVPVPVEGYEDKRIYVWFEALMGYVSGARIYSSRIGRNDYWKEFYLDPEVPNYYFMGKDNIPFHTIIWPAMLLAKGQYNLPHMVVANEYLRFKGRQFSKSRGIGFSVDEVLKVVDRDYLRFYLAFNLPEGGDSDFSLEDLQSRVNTELIDKFGNFIHRISSFVVNNNISPRFNENLMDEDDRKIISSAADIVATYRNHMENVEIKKALAQWMELVRLSNTYFNDSAPWALRKTNPEKCSMKLHISLVLAEQQAAMAYPFIPSSAETILKIIGSEKFSKEGFSMTLFTFNGSSFSPVRSDPPFRKLDIIRDNPNFADLKVGQISSVAPHPSADKLYIIRVNLGYRQAQVVAGLRPYYRENELVGRKVVIVDNLKWARLRGEESQGMLLAADDGRRVSLVTPEDQSVKPGTPVRIGDFDYNSSGKIDIDRLRDLKLHVEDIDGMPRVVAEIDGEILPLNVSGNLIVTHEPVKAGSIVR
ncbi:MAG: methionine--tRNA ligase [Candidatus Thermoplasmatota archaeon]|nr:methionine--tRNA ligase [Candidatus Thermoplasmatota archaeon]